MPKIQKILAVVPARAGSKGIPGKNIKVLCGKPLIVWVIEAAKNSKLINRIILSTDSEEIAEVGRKFGAEVPFLRPTEYAQDDSPDVPVFEHCLEWLRKNENYMPDIVVHLRPTGPLVTSQEIDAAISLLEKFPEAESVRSVELAPKPPYKMWQLEGVYMKPFALVPGLPDSHTAPRQVLPKVYQTTADIGVFRAQTLLQKNSIIGDKVLPFILNRPSCDIDEPLDFEIAEILLQKRQKNSQN
jgi:N-acylneuraminate cytidylyltransferase